MVRRQTLRQVGAPHPDSKTSPIMEETDEEFVLLAQAQEEQGFCYFNDVIYEDGSFICSGSSEMLRCEKGAWVREGGCDLDNP